MSPGLALALIYLSIGLLRLSVIVYLIPKIRRLKEVHDYNQRAWGFFGDQIGPFLLLELLVWPLGIAIGLHLWLNAREEQRKQVELRKKATEKVKANLAALNAPEGDFLGYTESAPPRSPDEAAAPSVFDGLNFHPDDLIDRPSGCLCLSCRKIRGEV